MCRRAVYIVSAKFAPGLMKEFGLLGAKLEDNGVSVQYLLAAGYRNLEWAHPETTYITGRDHLWRIGADTIRMARCRSLSTVFARATPALVYFYNTHPANLLLANAIKRQFPDVKIALHLHDPYKPDKTPYGLKGAVRIKIVEVIQQQIAMRADHIVFPSPYSLELFRTYYRSSRAATHVAPLLIPDQSDGAVNRPRHFCIVGRMHRATGHDTFLELANAIAAANLPYQLAFVCAGDVARYLSRLSPQARERLTIVNKPIITDHEIDVTMRESFAVFRLDREVTQSGVIPVAYMNRTPVIVRDIRGLRQHVTHGSDGYIVPDDCTVPQLLEGMDYVTEHFTRLSAGARRSYEQKWSEANWDTYYGWMISLLGSCQLPSMEESYSTQSRPEHASTAHRGNSPRRNSETSAP